MSWLSWLLWLVLPLLFGALVYHLYRAPEVFEDYCPYDLDGCDGLGECGGPCSESPPCHPDHREHREDFP